MVTCMRRPPGARLCAEETCTLARRGCVTPCAPLLTPSLMVWWEAGVSGARGGPPAADRPCSGTPRASRSLGVRTLPRAATPEEHVMRQPCYPAWRCHV